MRNHRTPRRTPLDRVPAAGPAPAAEDDDAFISYGGPCSPPPEATADILDRRHGVARDDDAPPDLVAAVMAMAGRATTTPRRPRSVRPGRSA